MKTQFYTATFIAFMLAKATSLSDRTHKGDITNDPIAMILNPVNDFFNSIGLTHLHAYQFVDLGMGFHGSTHIVNFLLTYIPVFFIILAIFSSIKFSTLFKFFVWKNTRDIKDGTNNYFKNSSENKKQEKPAKKASKLNIFKTKKQAKVKTFKPKKPSNMFLLRIVLGKDFHNFAD